MKKNERLLLAMSMAEEAYVTEADPSRKVGMKKNGRKLGVAVAVAAVAVCMAVASLGIWLFIPYGDDLPEIEPYRDSEYYHVIQSLARYYGGEPVYQNRAHRYTSMLMEGLSALFSNGRDKEAAGEVIAPGDGEIITFPANAEDVLLNGVTTGTQNSYEELTDNQVTGVTEADRIKRTNQYFFYLDDTTLKVFSAAGLDSEMIGSYSLYQNEMLFANHNLWEFYLSQDGSSVTAVVPYTNQDREAVVSVVLLDVRDPSNIMEQKRICITGSYLSSRVTEHGFLLMTRYHVNEGTVDYSDESTFLPQIDRGEGAESIPAGSIHCPQTMTSSTYTVVCRMDTETMEVTGSAAFLSYLNDVYVSRDRLYAAATYSEERKEDAQTVRIHQMTDISVMEYANDMTLEGTITVEGYIKDRYSLDEYNGLLRVVTTTDWGEARKIYELDGSLQELVTRTTGNTSANLYCINLNTWEIVGKAEAFAPLGETVRSVRFDGHTAYVCTAVQLTDPVFFFDLSDPAKITYKETGTIQGFSTSLIDFGEGISVGIGVGSQGDLKIEAYREGAETVESICAYQSPYTSYSTDYKSYYIDRENRLIGLGVNVYQNIDDTDDKGGERYLLLHFDGYELYEVANEALAGRNDYKRGVYDDGYLYLFGSNDFSVVSVSIG